jgi:hypothetical protein
MIIEEVTNEEMCCLFAPDGSWQPMTLASDFAMCVAQIRLLHSKGLCQSYHQFSMKGFKILPIKVTMVQDGDEETAYNRAKETIR